MVRSGEVCVFYMTMIIIEPLMGILSILPLMTLAQGTPLG